MKTKKLIKYLVLAMIVGILFSGCSNAPYSASTNMKKAQKIVREGKVNEPSDYTTLGYAVREPNNGKIIRYLLDNGANINASRTNGKNCKHTPILIAIEDEYTLNQYTSKLKLLDNIEILLKHGDNCKDSALFHTIALAQNDGTNKHLPLVEMLLSYGANPDKKFNNRWGKNISTNDLIRQEAQKNAGKKSSKRSWNTILTGINNGLSTTSSDWNKINNNINNATSTRATPKRWQDMSESEKKSASEKYKYLNGSEVKSKVSPQKSESASVDNKSTPQQNKRDKHKSRYGDCFHYCEGLSGKIHDKSTSAGACEKGCSLKHWLSISEKAHNKCKEKFGVGNLAQECHEAVKRY